jgi:hypothetical protein
MRLGELPPLGTSLVLRLGRSGNGETQHGDEGQAEDCVAQRHQVMRDESGGQCQGEGGWKDELHDRTMPNAQQARPVPLLHWRIVGCP